jgi:2-polyprenyl-3-methyl-5-hydroxy-6-metoxy-1,4-benzoquinol methylase
VLRRVEPEILDSLECDHPDARASRRDLRRINSIMGNHRWLARRIHRSRRQPDWRILELGAGDGTLGRRLVTRGIVEARHLMAMDLAPQPADWPADARWIQRDVLAGDMPDAEIVVANLFLHHFETAELRKLGSLLPPTCRYLLASEPTRRRLHLWQSNFLSLLPINRVTRHDMPVSIRAGFLGEELGEALGVQNWKILASTTFFGAYRFEAHR